MKEPKSTWSPASVPSQKGEATFIPFHSKPLANYSGHQVFTERALQQAAMTAETRRSQLVAIAAAYVHDCDQFDNFVFTGFDDPKRGKQPRSEAERSVSNIFAARRRTLASKQARDGGWSESELQRALRNVRDSERRRIPTPMNPSFLLFKDPL